MQNGCTRLAGRSSGGRSQRAFTLIEVLLVCLVLGIALQLTGSAFTGAVAQYRGASAMHHLQSVFALARHEALLRRRAITLCAVNASGACTRDWRYGHTISAFIDDNENRRLDVGERRLQALRWPMKDGELSWRASLARRFIRFEPNGATWQNGTLYYCPGTRDARQARALILSHSGRSYLSRDSNADGIREDRSGRNLRC